MYALHTQEYNAAKKAWCAKHGKEDDHAEDGDDHDALYDCHDDHEEEEEGHEEKGHDDHDDHGEEEKGFPLPYALFCVGFIVMLLLEQVVFKKPAAI